MKRFIAVILTILYMSTAMGATVQLHYCMGKLVAWELGSSKKDHCKGCGMELPAKNTSKKKCCQDEYKEIKLKKDYHNPATAGAMVPLALEATPVTMYTLQAMPVASLAVTFPVAQAPPDTGNTPVFLLNCNFRI
ncbi:HYC_CC_PP family protein [Chitinophaga rupis]|nr:hypothetical protein [Chitinophaga rupis]